MNKKSLPLLIVTGLMGLSCLTGCKDNFKGITINFWHTFGKTPADSIEAQAKRFATLVKENEGVDVRVKFSYQGGYGDILSKTTKSFVSGETPTIAVAYPDHVADYFGAETRPGQYVVDLSKYVNDASIGFGKESYLGDKHNSSDIVEAFWEEGCHYTREGVYSLPYMKSSEVMFYNMNAVRAFMPYYDAEATTDDDIRRIMENMTWDELMEFCEIIVDTNKTAKLFPTLDNSIGPCFYDSDGNFMISKLYQEEIGYSSIDANGNGVIDFNGVAGGSFVPSESQVTEYNKMIAFLKKYKALYDKHLFTTKGVFGEYGSNNFTLQKTIFSIGSSGGAGYNFPSTSTFEVGICKVPSSATNPNNTNLYVSQGPTLCLFNDNSISADKNEEKLKYAWKFMKYITNEEVNADLCVNGSEGYIPVRTSAYATQTFIDFMRDGEKYAKTAKTVIQDINGSYINTPVFRGSAGLRDAMAGCLADVLKSDGSDTKIKEVLDRAISNAVMKM